MARLVKRETPMFQPLVYTEPFNLFGSVDRAFDRLFEAWPAFLPVRWPLATSTISDSYIPVDEYYQEGSLVIRAEVPGIDPDKDVDLTVTGGMLTMKVERHQEETVEEERYLRREIHRGSFERTLALPEGVTESDVKATYKDGILEIVVPKADVEPVRRVAISKS